jgi:predicted GNAT superfamily acetyltransferase
LLKRKQKQIAQERGFDLAAWTFDPLIAKNAHFNFSKLGVISRVYFLDYYGPMRDSINSGLETDRFFAESFLHSDIVERLRVRVKSQIDNAHVAVTTRGRQNYVRCSDWKTDIHNLATIVDIPRDIERIKRLSLEDAKTWRLATRELLTTYFRAGFTALDLIRRGKDFGYVLFKAKIDRSISPVHESAE